MTQNREDLVRDNHEVRDNVYRALEQSATGDVVYLGTFAQYA